MRTGVMEVMRAAVGVCRVSSELHGFYCLSFCRDVFTVLLVPRELQSVPNEQNLLSFASESKHLGSSSVQEHFCLSYDEEIKIKLDSFGCLFFFPISPS